MENQVVFYCGYKVNGRRIIARNGSCVVEDCLYLEGQWPDDPTLRRSAYVKSHVSPEGKLETELHRFGNNLLSDCAA